MNAVVEAKSMFRVVPRGVDQQKGEWLRAVARFFRLTYSQAKKIEYEEVQDMRASRLDAMRATVAELQERADQRRGIANEIAAQLDQMDQAELHRLRPTKVG
jgi:4-alpha-glucanotransferase